MLNMKNKKWSFMFRLDIVFIHRINWKIMWFNNIVNLSFYVFIYFSIIDLTLLSISSFFQLLVYNGLLRLPKSVKSTLSNKINSIEKISFYMSKIVTLTFFFYFIYFSIILSCHMDLIEQTTIFPVGLILIIFYFYYVSLLFWSY